MKFEKIRSAMAGEEPDEIPVSLWRHFPGMDLEASSLCRAHLSFQRRFDPDLIKLCPSGGYASLAFGAEIEYYDSPLGAPRTRVYVVRDAEDWASLDEPDVQGGVLGEMIRAAERLNEALEGEVPIIQTVFSPLTICKNIGGERLLRDMREEPEPLLEGLKVIMRTMVEFTEANLDAGASGIFFATQMATYDTMSEGEYRLFGMRFDLPVLRAAQRRPLLNVVHIHGQNIMFDLIAENYPADALNWHDKRTRPDLGEASRRFGGLLLGGIDELGILVDGSEEDVEEMVKASVRSVSGRRLLLAPGCVIPLNAPEANLDAVIRTARSYRSWKGLPQPP